MTDHLHHWTAIADHLGVKPDAARHLAKTQGLPVFRLGRTVAASRAKIDLWRSQRIAAAERDSFKFRSLAIDPTTILASLPKAGGREAILFRHVKHGRETKLEITLAETRPGKQPRALRSIGIGPELLAAFAEAATATVRTLLNGLPP